MVIFIFRVYYHDQSAYVSKFSYANFNQIPKMAVKKNLYSKPSKNYFLTILLMTTFRGDK